MQGSSRCSGLSCFADGVHGWVSERLQKYLARSGVGSRRACERLIEGGRVLINGKPAHLGQSIEPGHDRVQVDERDITPPETLAYWMVHKPYGHVTTASDPQGRTTVMELLPPGLPRLFPVGRLDRDSTGLLLFSNDGQLTQRLLHPSHQCWKAYHCGLDQAIVEADLQRLRNGLTLDDGPTAPCRAHWRGDHLQIEIHEGRKRQVRRMLAHLGYRVVWLCRVNFGPLHLGDLEPGQARPLTPREVEALRSG